MAALHCRVRDEFEEALLQLQGLGHLIACTPGTAAFYTHRGIKGIIVLRKPTDEARTPLNGPATPTTGAETGIPSDGTGGEGTGGSDDTHLGCANATTAAAAVEAGEGAVLEWIRSKRVDLVINIPEGSTRSDEVTSGYLMRRTAVDFGCSLLTNIKYVHLLISAECASFRQCQFIVQRSGDTRTSISSRYSCCLRPT